MYIAIENIANTGHMFCCCQVYSGCQITQNFLRKIKRYCCYCQSVDQYSFHSLHEIKKDATRLQALYYEVFNNIEILKFYKDINQIILEFDIFDPHCYTSNLNQGEKLNQLKNFLFYS